MSPPISKEWWLAAALTGVAAQPALGQQVASIDRRQIGVVTSVQPGTTAVRTTPLIADGTKDQRIVNDSNAPMHVMFADQSAITIGPNSSAILKDFNYNSEQKTGNIALELTKGVMRVVGGFISKKNPVTVTTKTATIGVRGGISIVSAEDNETKAAFLYGDAMEVTTHRAPGAVSDAGMPMAELGSDDAGEGAGGDFVTGQRTVVQQPGFIATVTVRGGIDVSKLTAAALSQLNAALATIVTQAAAKPAAPAAPGAKPAATRVTVPITVPGPTPGTTQTITIPVTISIRQITGSTRTGS